MSLSRGGECSLFASSHVDFRIISRIKTTLAIFEWLRMLKYQKIRMIFISIFAKQQEIKYCEEKKRESSLVKCMKAFNQFMFFIYCSHI